MARATDADEHFYDAAAKLLRRRASTLTSLCRRDTAAF